MDNYCDVNDKPCNDVCVRINVYLKVLSILSILATTILMSLISFRISMAQVGGVGVT